MPLRTSRLYLDLAARSDQRLATSLEDPTTIDPGPLWIEGDKFPIELYICELRGQAVEPIELPAAYTCTVSAKRADAANDTEIFSAALARGTGQQDGHQAFTGTIDLTGADVAQTLLIEDAQLTEGVRLRVQVKIASAGDAEIRRPAFIAILRANLDPAA